MGRAWKVVEGEKEQSYVPETTSKTTDCEREEYEKKTFGWNDGQFTLDSLDAALHKLC
jgi:hypothetical protein